MTSDARVSMVHTQGGWRRRIYRVVGRVVYIAGIPPYVLGCTRHASLPSPVSLLVMLFPTTF